MRIAMVAGEASGDLLAAHLIKAIRVRYPRAQFCGIGGPRMQAEGFDSWWPSETLSVMGYVDALKRLPSLLKLRAELLKRIARLQPDVFIGVDAPDFNLGVETRLRKTGCKTIHYVSPSIWAWRGGRVHKVGRAADLVLCLFPFEPEIYERHGIAARFVGHPLADVFPEEPDRAHAREVLQVEPESVVVAVLPGSRNGEVGRLAEPMVGAIRLLAERFPDAHFLVPLITRETWDLFASALRKADIAPERVRLVFGHAHEAMTAADVVLVASGTASLEAALLKRPMVITYRIGSMSYRIIRRMGYLPWVGLPNILAREFLVPELIQDDATPEKLADAVAHWLGDQDACARLHGRFREMHGVLRQNCADRAAEAVMSLVGRS